MMDLTNLSSNWKKLQSTLESEKKQAHGYPTKTSSASAQHSKILKRKALEVFRPQNPNSSLPRKRRKTPDSVHNITKSPRNMGGYLSTLPAAPKTTENPTTSAKFGTNVKAPPLAYPSAQVANAMLQDPTAAGKYIAVDCEMVGTHSLTPFSTPAHNTTPGAPPEYSILARVSLVSYSLITTYDAYVLPPTGVVVSDYRTQYSGITPWHLNASNPTTMPKPFTTIQREVAELISGRILIGHAIKNDLAVLGLSHPRREIRDTARHPPFRQLAATVGKDGKLGKGRTPSLKKLAKEVLGMGIQQDEHKGHSSIEDAKATMALFRKEKAGFEREFVKTYGRSAFLGVGKKNDASIITSTPRKFDGQEEDNDESDSTDDGVGEDDGDEVTGRGEKKKKKKGKRKKRTKR